MDAEQVKKKGWYLGGLPLAQLFDTHESGTAVEFNNVRYHRVEEGISLTSKGKALFFTASKGADATVGETNMLMGQQLEKGHWFTIEKIAVKVSQRKPSDSEDFADKQWYQRVLNTLFAYGVLRVYVGGPGYLGDFPLAQLLPAVQSVGQLGGIVTCEDTSLTSSNTAPVLAAGVFDLQKNNIKISESVNFNVELEWDIPSEIWDAKENKWRNLDAKNALDLELMQVPDGTSVEVMLVGEEIRLQG